MGEKIMSPAEQFAFIFSLLITLATIFIIVTLFVNTSPEVDTNSLVRLNAEIADNILTSNLAVPRAVFSAKELDGLKGSKLEDPVRHCSTGYFLQVKTQDKEWSFGYQPEIFTDGRSASQEYLAAVSDNGIRPAKMTLTTYENMMTKISCMIEKAYKLGEIQKTEIPCFILQPEQGTEQFILGQCMFSFYRKEELGERTFICTSSIGAFGRKLTECRYLPEVQFDSVLEIYSLTTKDDKAAVLKAYPVKRGTSCEAVSQNNQLATQEPETVILCIE